MAEKKRTSVAESSDRSIPATSETVSAQAFATRLGGHGDPPPSGSAEVAGTREEGKLMEKNLVKDGNTK